MPGLYSWWVNADGAHDLTRRLGEPIRPGLIYAGLAGATRWPSGKRSTNTLWSRIVGVHLAGRTSSRPSATPSAPSSPPTRHDEIDEEQLTTWMTRHLAVRTVASPDPTRSATSNA